MSERERTPFDYPRAGQRGVPQIALLVEGALEDMAHAGVPLDRLGPSLVQGFARFFRDLPKEGPGVDKNQVPLLYMLLGSGTPPLKMSKPDAAYQERPVGQQRCGNCSSAYRNLVTGDLICSQVSSEISENGWCRLWNADRF